MSLPATNDFDETQELALYHSFPIGFPAKHGFPAQICLAEGRVSLFHFPPNAPAPLPRRPVIRPPLSEMSFF